VSAFGTCVSTLTLNDSPTDYYFTSYRLSFLSWWKDRKTRWGGRGGWWDGGAPVKLYRVGRRKWRDEAENWADKCRLHCILMEWYLEAQGLMEVCRGSRKANRIQDSFDYTAIKRHSKWKWSPAPAGPCMMTNSSVRTQSVFWLVLACVSQQSPRLVSRSMSDEINQQRQCQTCSICFLTNDELRAHLDGYRVSTS